MKASKLIEEQINECINEINSLHASVSRTNWAELNRQGFVFALEQNTTKARNIYLKFDELNRELKMLLEKNSPNYSNFLIELSKELIVLEANVSMEKRKKLRQELINETEAIEMPELYSSMQQKILNISLKMRYNIDKAKTFMLSRKTSPIQKGKTAKNLIEVLQKKEDEVNELKQENIELKRKTFFGNVTEKTLAEIELEAHEMDKEISLLINETKKSLKTHFAQINYVEGSFIQLKKQVEEIEKNHSNFIQKNLELVKELKKERDFANTLALEIEKDGIEKRSEYTKKIIEFEEKKTDIEEKIKERYEKELSTLKRGLKEKNIALLNSQKLINELEKEIKKIKKKRN